MVRPEPVPFLLSRVLRRAAENFLKIFVSKKKLRVVSKCVGKKFPEFGRRQNSSFSVFIGRNRGNILSTKLG
jgi:hypothetical protein